jgi:hypothetical protein
MKFSSITSRQHNKTSLQAARNCLDRNKGLINAISVKISEYRGQVDNKI